MVTLDIVFGSINESGENIKVQSISSTYAIMLFFIFDSTIPSKTAMVSATKKYIRLSFKIYEIYVKSVNGLLIGAIKESTVNTPPKMKASSSITKN